MTKQGRHSLILDTLPRSAPHWLVEGHASAQNTDPLRSQKYNILTHTHSQTNSPQLKSNTPRHLLSELQRIQAHSLNRLRLCQCVDIGTDTYKHTHIELVVCVCVCGSHRVIAISCSNRRGKRSYVCLSTSSSRETHIEREREDVTHCSLADVLQRERGREREGERSYISASLPDRRKTDRLLHQPRHCEGVKLEGGRIPWKCCRELHTHTELISGKCVENNNTQLTAAGKITRSARTKCAQHVVQVTSEIRECFTPLFLCQW